LLLERGDYSQEQREKLESNRNYWNSNYEALRTQIFYRDNPVVNISEKTERS